VRNEGGGRPKHSHPNALVPAEGFYEDGGSSRMRRRQYHRRHTSTCFPSSKSVESQKCILPLIYIVRHQNLFCGLYLLFHPQIPTSTESSERAATFIRRLLFGCFEASFRHYLRVCKHSSACSFNFVRLKNLDPKRGNGVQEVIRNYEFRAAAEGRPLLRRTSA